MKAKRTTRLACTMACATLFGLCGVWPAAQAQLVLKAGYIGTPSDDQKAAVTFAENTIASKFTNPITVNILFNFTDLGATGGFSKVNTAISNDPYATYTGLMKTTSTATPGNTVLATAVANLANGNGADGTKEIWSSQVDQEALGATGITPCYDATGTLVGTCGQLYDGVVTMNTNAGTTWNYTTNTTAIPAANGSNTQYDAIITIEHEIFEILGIGGIGSTLNTKNQVAGTKGGYGAMDLFRYSADKTPSYDTDAAVNAYFAVDGGASSIIKFNQISRGDYGDWGQASVTGANTQNGLPQCASNTSFYGEGPGLAGLVQDAFVCPNDQHADFTVNSPEYLALEAIGYNPVPVPAALWSLLSALGALAGARRLRGG